MMENDLRHAVKRGAQDFRVSPRTLARLATFTAAAQAVPPTSAPRGLGRAQEYNAAR